MKEWELSAKLVALGHRISVSTSGFRCAECARTIPDILRYELACAPGAPVPPIESGHSPSAPPSDARNS